MDGPFRFPSATGDRGTVDAWFAAAPPGLGEQAATWFERMRACGRDVRELIHDGHPTACVEDAAFAYVAVFAAHANVGFFRGAELPDPAGLLAGTGKRMRHVKLRPGKAVDEAALALLIEAAYRDMKRRLAAEAAGG